MLAWSFFPRCCFHFHSSVINAAENQKWGSNFQKGRKKKTKQRMTEKRKKNEGVQGRSTIVTLIVMSHGQRGKLQTCLFYNIRKNNEL
jgi:hypothetical protein